MTCRSTEPWTKFAARIRSTKFRAFGFDTVVIDGHDFDAMEAAFAHVKEVKGKPCVIIAKTVKEGCLLHGKPGGLARYRPQ